MRRVAGAGILVSIPYAHTLPQAAKRAKHAEQAEEVVRDHQLVVSITRIALSRFGEVRHCCAAVGQVLCMRVIIM